MVEAKRPGMLAAIKKVVADGWVNVITGLGAARDKRSFARVEYLSLREQEAEELYAADDIAATIVDTLPEDALREWLTVTSDVDQLAPKLEAEVERLQVAHRLATAWSWARLYGGAALLINVDDSKDLALPIDLAAVREFQSLTALTRYELQYKDLELDITSPRYGKPTTYTLQPRRAGTTALGQVIHHTRLIVFEGVRLPLRQLILNQYWGDSVLTRAAGAIKNYNISNDAAATILQEFNQGVFKIKNLADMLLAGQDEAVAKRLEMINLARSICRAVVIDQDEDFSNVGAAVTGIPDMLGKVAQRLVVASRMPHTKLLGESPSGLGASGESEQADWYDFVSNQQELVLRPKLQFIFEIVMSARKGPTSGKIPDDWAFEFKPLKQLDEGKQALARKTQAEVDQIYISNNVVDPDEIAVARFGGGKYSFETTLDLTARKASIDNPGQPGAPAPGPGGALNIQTQALNGAQVTSLLAAVGQVARGEIPRDAALETIMLAFQVDRATADRLLGDAGKGFTPTPAATPPAPGAA